MGAISQIITIALGIFVVIGALLWGAHEPERPHEPSKKLFSKRDKS